MSRSVCTFCLQDCWTEVNEVKVVGFICRELGIDFERTFPWVNDPLDPQPLLLPLCPPCHKLFFQVGQVQILLEEMRGQLDKLLTFIRTNVILSPSNNNLSCSQTVRTLRTHIIRSNFGDQSLDKGREEAPDVQMEEEHDFIEETTEEVRVKTEPLNNAEDDLEMKAFLPSDVLIPVVSDQAADQLEGKLEANEDPTTAETKSVDKKRKKENPKETVKFKCELCKTDKEYEEYYFRMHIKEDHKDAEIIHKCQQYRCNRQFPVESLWNLHIKFHQHRNTHPYGQYECDDCDRRMAMKVKDSHLDWHRRMLTRIEGVKNVQCQFCEAKSIFSLNIREHELERHQNELLYSCDQCEQKYSSGPMLETHLQTHTSGPYGCSLCETTYQKSDDLENHLIRCHIPRPQKQKRATPLQVKGNECEVCGKYFAVTKNLAKHLKLHTEDRATFECELCPGTHLVYPRLVNHYLRLHENGQKVHTCSKQNCSKSFCTQFMFDRHMKNHRWEAQKPLVCEVCDLRYRTNEELQYHVNRCHKREKQFHCTGVNCNKSFLHCSSLRHHERLHHPELLTHDCTLCDKVFSDETILNTHVKTHADPNSPGPLSCDVCSQNFLKPKILADHLTSHSGDFKVACNQCPREFRYKSQLLKHMASHGTAKPYSCDVCQRQFRTRSGMKLHREGHEDVPIPDQKPPRPCRHCGLQLPTKRLLKAHLTRDHYSRQNTEARCCEICGKTVRDIKTHMAIHLGNKKRICYFCDKRFLRPDALQCHLWIHTKEKPFKCYMCPTEFNQSHCLKSHFKKIHKMDWASFHKQKSQNSDTQQSKESLILEAGPFNDMKSIDFDILIE